jgi:dolichyl-phosphate-mannose--protein O-mannosyl transferase
VFTARYALSPYIKQIRFVFKRLIYLVFVFVLLQLDVFALIRLDVYRDTHVDSHMVAVLGHNAS